MENKEKVAIADVFKLSLEAYKKKQKSDTRGVEKKEEDKVTQK